MKNLKKTSCLLLALSLVLGLLAVPSVSVQAAAKKATVTKKVRMWPNSHDDYSIDILYANSGDQIKNIKTSSKNLTAKQTAHSTATGYYSNYDEYRRARIGLYAKKNGTYTVKFDIYSSDGKTKRSSHSVKVYVKNDSPIKSIKLSGKDIPRYTTKKSGKLSIKMTKGYSLKKIEVVTYDSKGNAVTKTVKNNKTISLGKYPYRYTNSYSYEPDSSYSNDIGGSYNSWHKSMFGSTEIVITYRDKWTKDTQTTYYTIYRTK